MRAGTTETAASYDTGYVGRTLLRGIGLERLTGSYEFFTASTTSWRPCLASEKSIMVLSVS